jgi:phage/plasmid-associated DNA primase
MKLILRQTNAADMVGIQSITQKHNTAIQGKRVVVINEMSSTRDEFKSNFDKIKSYITDPVISIEPKGVNPYSIDNIGNYLLFTNHRDAIIVEEHDRRYAIFEMSTAKMNNNEYFGMLKDECFNQDVADSFYTYLLDYAVVDVRNIPNTALRQEMMSLSKSTPLRFLEYALDEGKDEIWDEETTIGASAFYQRYVEWCRDNGERNCYTSTKFGTAIKGKIEKKRVTSGMVYVLP